MLFLIKAARFQALLLLGLLTPLSGYAETFAIGSCPDSQTSCEVDPADLNFVEVAQGLIEFNGDGPVEYNIASSELPRNVLVTFPLTKFDVSNINDGLYTFTIQSKDSSAVSSDIITLPVSIFLPLSDEYLNPVYLDSISLAENGGGFSTSSFVETSVLQEFEISRDKSDWAGGPNTIQLFGTDSSDIDSDVISIMIPKHPDFANGIASASISFVEGFVDVDPGLGNAQALAGTEVSYAGSVVQANITVGTHQLNLRSKDSSDETAQLTLGLGYLDSDGDGLVDDLDKFPNNALAKFDLDNDNVADINDTDIDGDGVANDIDAFERDASESVDTDGDLVGNNADDDDDNDGILDQDELDNGLNPLVSNVGVDTDNDGLNDIDEFAAGTDPRLVDSDGDGLSDGDELAVGLDPAQSNDEIIAQQLLTSSSRYIRVVPGKSATIAWQYDTSDAQADLSGLTLRVHYDRNILRLDDVPQRLPANFISQSAVINDTADFDNDPGTNSYVEFVWSDANDTWPGVLPADLLRITYTMIGSLQGFDTTHIRVSAGSVPQRIDGSQIVRYRLTSELVEVGFGETGFNIDVNGDGDIDPFDDGVIILRYLLNFPVQDIATDGDLLDATKTREEIFQDLEATR